MSANAEASQDRGKMRGFADDAHKRVFLLDSMCAWRMQVARHRSGRSAGFAIVTFARREEAQRAINLMGENENYSLHGRKLQIRWYTPEVQQGNMAAAQGVLNSLLSGRAPASDVANFDPSPWGAQTPLLAIQQALLASTQLETPTKAAEDALKALEALVSPRPGIDTSPLQHAAGLQVRAHKLRCTIAAHQAHYQLLPA